MPKVLNRKGDLPIDRRNSIYIGRPSEYGNKFSHMSETLAEYKVKDRDEACDRYAEWFDAQPEYWKKRVLAELRGHDLECWCWPLRCHGDFLLLRANE